MTDPRPRPFSPRAAAGRATRRRRAIAFACLFACAAAQDAPARLATRETRDWRDDVVYFAMIDRFDDGDPRNNDQGAGEYDPRDGRRYSGGDLAGLRRRLDYIRGLGATALWTTPPVANQWWNDRSQYGGFHGYWASDFSRIDAHVGALADYRALADALHARDMRLIQDIVVNHTADYFHYEGAYDPAQPQRGFALYRQYDGRTAPTQAPFDRNDARDPAQRAAGIYHWTPAIRDFGDPRQVLDWQLADLDDLNTGNPVVATALRDTYARWIRDVGVDAFRVDTVFYVPPTFFDDFLNAEDPAHPGVRRVAAANGKPDFLVFGEGFGIDPAHREEQARRIETYATGEDGRRRMDGMLNFPLYGTLGDVFARGHAPEELGARIASTMRVHRDPWRMPSFVDNHDVDRFLADGGEPGLKQALLATMTLPGIPVIYAGTEQGFREQRASMFAGGWGSGGRDHFDVEAPLYRYLQRAIALRRAHRLFSRGAPHVLAANAAAPGAIAWRMDGGADADGAQALIAFNTADHATLLDALPTGLPPGTRLAPAFAIDGEAPSLRVDAEGRVDMVLPPRAGWVWRVLRDADARPAAKPAAPTIDADAPARVVGDLALAGGARPGARVQLAMDGDLSNAVETVADARGRWRATLRTDDMLDPAIAHRVVARDAARGAVSPAHAFAVARAWTPALDVDDPAGDDTGPDGRYTYPDDAGWRARHPADLLGARVWTSGGALKLQLRMRDVVADWHPANGYDHVAFTLYLQLPGRDDGATAMPLQQATLPDGMRWQLRLRTHGWSNALTAFDGDGEGRATGEAVRIDADTAADTVTFVWPARALGRLRSLAGLRVHVTTWDYDGGYRPLGPEAGPHRFGGGAEDGAKVMDSLTFALPATALPAAR